MPLLHSYFIWHPTIAGYCAEKRKAFVNLDGSGNGMNMICMMTPGSDGLGTAQCSI